MKPARHGPARRGSEAKLERGPNGRKRCRFCGTETKPPRRTFCSDACVEQWLIRSSAQGARNAVAKRDHGVCAGCGLDTRKLERRVAAATMGLWRRPAHDVEARKRRRESVREEALSRIRTSHPAVWRALQGRWTKTPWEADHIVPVVKGGGTCGLNNLRTLCRDCHVAETAKLRRELNAAKRDERTAQMPLFRKP